MGAKVTVDDILDCLAAMRYRPTSAPQQNCRSDVVTQAGCATSRNSRVLRISGLSILTLLKNRNMRAARVTCNNAAIFHFVNPIAGLGDDRVVRGEEQRLPALLHDVS